MAKPPQAPDENQIAEGGELLIFAKGALIMIATKRGGLIDLSEPHWIKLNVWQVLAIFGHFIGQYSTGQIEAISKMISHAKPN